MSLPSNAVLPAGSLVLVTGANGFVGCETANQFLSYGYRVRGVVRDTQKNAWIQEHFDKTYGTGKFELAEVKKLDEEGALDAATQGCDGVVHTASNLSFSPDPNVVINEAINFTLSALKSAAKSPSVKRFVLTSSSAAAVQGIFNEPYDLTPESWNSKAVEAAWAPPPYKPERGVAVYCASKVQGEEAMWKFIKENKPSFVANAVLPDFVVGAPVNIEKQGYPSSVGALYSMWSGDDFWRVLYPQFSVDVHDTAILHVAALITPDAKNERIFAFGHNKTWTDWIKRLTKMYPDHKFPDPPENEGMDMANVTARPRAEQLLKSLGRDGFRPVDESIKEVYDTFS